MRKSNTYTTLPFSVEKVMFLFLEKWCCSYFKIHLVPSQGYKAAVPMILFLSACAATSLNTLELCNSILKNRN
jgi:hypothetical protein